MLAQLINLKNLIENIKDERCKFYLNSLIYKINNIITLISEENEDKIYSVLEEVIDALEFDAYNNNYYAEYGLILKELTIETLHSFSNIHLLNRLKDNRRRYFKECLLKIDSLLKDDKLSVTKIQLTYLEDVIRKFGGNDLVENSGYLVSRQYCNPFRISEIKKVARYREDLQIKVDCLRQKIEGKTNDI